MMLAEAHDPTGPLPDGHQLLEASAGTGKTHAIVWLAVRYLAEGRCRADQLLIVTFSRSATRELRGRLLQRLAGTVDVLDRARQGVPIPDGDRAALAAHLADGDDVDEAHQRLRTALADIDHATVTTIHGFADDLLRRVGDPALGGLIEDDGDLAQEILSDVYLRMVRVPEGEWLGDALPYATFATPIIAAGMRYPREAIVPAARMDTIGGARAFMAICAGIEARARKEAAGVHDYDDLLRRLEGRLTNPNGGRELAAAIAARFRVGLVDEFQDTDPVQWTILSALFPDTAGADGRALVMVGDPKQAIYAFRGADVGTYRTARAGAPVRTLLTNWRTDRPLVDAVGVLFDGVPLGEDITTHPVIASHDVRIDGADAPVGIRVVTPDAPVPTYRGTPRVGPLRDFVAADVAERAVALLDAGHRLATDDGDGQRPLTPEDVAVLVRTNAQAARVQRQLTARGVASVLNGVGNVLRTPAARDWLTVLRALQQPSDGRLARHAALSDLFGWSHAQVVDGDADDVDRLHVQLHRMAAVVDADGLIAGLRWLDGDSGVSPRLRAQPGGGRRLVDLLHVAELLNAEERASGLGLSGLVSWLEAVMAGASEPPPAELSRRLEQAVGAVEIVTVHGAKGLQWPVTLVPYLWDTPQPPTDVLAYTDPRDGVRRVDVGGRKDTDAGRDMREEWAKQERVDEEARLAYVALTRAEHHTIVWWGTGRGAIDSPLAALLARGGARPRDAAAALDAARRLADAHPDAFDVAAVDRDVPTTVLPASDVELTLPVATLGREIDHGWRRYSYSGVVNQAAAEDVHRATADRVPDDDGPPTIASAAGKAPIGGDAVVPLAEMPAGADAGTAVHAVLEHVDFTADPLEPELERHLARVSATSPVDLTGDDRTVHGLAAAIATPLGPLAGGAALRDLGRADRLDELAFELPVLDGPAARTPGTVLMGHLAELLRTRLPADDPLAGYADQLDAALGTVEVRGFLAGFIDLLARVPGPDGRSRFLVIDHKTNRLAPSGGVPLRVDHYAPAAMATAMAHNHYPVQALFYALAAHRFLRWRIPDYDPDRDLAGVAYLFVRGMVGPKTPVGPDGTPYGVFAWRPPTALLLAVDDLFAAGPGTGP